MSESEVERQIEALEQLDLAGARWAWHEATGHDAAPGASRDLLVRALAYRLQAKVYGDLDRRFKRLLNRIADGEYAAVMVSNGPGTNLEPGTILVREYKGEIYRATVLAEGYAWDGQIFPTLSGVARAITKSNWNGYVFFGLKPKPDGKVIADG